jgi:hypothetical protein
MITQNPSFIGLSGKIRRTKELGAAAEQIGGEENGDEGGRQPIEHVTRTGLINDSALCPALRGTAEAVPYPKPFMRPVLIRYSHFITIYL